MPAITKKKRGRPRKPDSEKRRNNVTIRMKDDLKRRLEEAADSQGRSLSEEIEFSLERRFLEEAAYGGKELNGLLMLMVGAAEIIQARTEKSWSSDWETSIAVQEAWKKLAAAAGPSPPAEFIQHGEQVDKLPQPPELPTSPSPPGGGEILQWYAYVSENPDRRADTADAKAFEAEMAVFQKAWKKYDRLSAKYERKVEAFRQDTQAWLDTITRYEDLGKDAAAELFPRREAVMQTAIPAQHVEKTKEK